MIPVVNAAQAAQWDRESIAAGMPSRVLMENAGRAVADAVLRRYQVSARNGVVIGVGRGNNGGDGWVVARTLRRAGVTVWVVECEGDRTPDCEANRGLALQSGVDVVEPGAWGRHPIGAAVDALLGTGSAGAPRGRVGEIATLLKGLSVPVVAVDGPTGLDLATGEACDVVPADLTVTFGALRRGHLLARDMCGTIVVADIGFTFDEPVLDWPLLVDGLNAASLRRGFSPTMHKGSRGRLVIMGGDQGMAGALHHAGQGAFAAGIGLVRLVADRASADALQEQFPDAMVTASALGPAVEPEVAKAIEWADAVVLGPGLGRGADRTAFVREVLAFADVPVLVDADALHCGFDAACSGPGLRVLTPHAGEFKGLFPDIGGDRFAAIERVGEVLGSEAARVTVLLKGVPTLVWGKTHRRPGTPREFGVRVVARGNPGLATGGSGDVLAGLIGALLAQGGPGPDAACLGAYLLGRAAEIAAEPRSVVTMRPADVVGAMAAVWKELEQPPAACWPWMLELPPPQLT